MTDENTQVILQRLDEQFTQIDSRFTKLEDRLAKVELEAHDSNTRIDAYQKASNQVVNLAFTVITAAAAVTILSPAVKAVAEYFTR